MFHLSLLHFPTILFTHSINYYGEDVAQAALGIFALEKAVAEEK